MTVSKERRRAVVLLSGGLDSTTAAAMAKESGFDLLALSFLYGQRHAIEIEAAKRVGSFLGVQRHVFQTIDLRAFGGSALTGDVAVPKPKDVSAIGHEIPVTYVPARNTIFLAFALAYAEVTETRDIFIGVNAVDYSGYPDCRPEFIGAFETLARLATKAGAEGATFSVHTPLGAMSKADIIREGLRLGVDYGLTHSCYDPAADGTACGACDSCLLRLQGFAEAGVSDPLRYADRRIR